MIPGHYTESKMLPATQGRIGFLPAWIRATAAMQRFGRYQRKNGLVLDILVLDIVNVSSLTRKRHWPCAAAMVLMPFSAPTKVLA
jgi:hypothetical protein